MILFWGVWLWSLLFLFRGGVVLLVCLGGLSTLGFRYSREKGG